MEDTLEIFFLKKGYIMKSFPYISNEDHPLDNLVIFKIYFCIYFKVGCNAYFNLLFRSRTDPVHAYLKVSPTGLRGIDF